MWPTPKAGPVGGKSSVGGFAPVPARNPEAMPHTVRKGKGSKPWKIVNKNTGETKGSSKTKKKAQASARIRDRRAKD